MSNIPCNCVERIVEVCLSSSRSRPTLHRRIKRKQCAATALQLVELVDFDLSSLLPGRSHERKNQGACRRPRLADILGGGSREIAAVRRCSSKYFVMCVCCIVLDSQIRHRSDASTRTQPTRHALAENTLLQLRGCIKAFVCWCVTPGSRGGRTLVQKWVHPGIRQIAVGDH